MMFRSCVPSGCGVPCAGRKRRQIHCARPLKRAIQAQLKNPLAKQILEGRFAAKDTIKVDCKGGVMKFDKG
jgi:ATP-dependent Clp protease ATP-binding subunit ClpA